MRAPAAGLPAARPQFRQGGRGWHSCVTPPSAATGGRSRPLVFRARDRRRLHARAPGSEERGDGGSQEGWGEPGGHTWFTEEDAREQKLLGARTGCHLACTAAVELGPCPRGGRARASVSYAEHSPASRLLRGSRRDSPVGIAAWCALQSALSRSYFRERPGTLPRSRRRGVVKKWPRRPVQ